MNVSKCFIVVTYLFNFVVLLMLVKFHYEFSVSAESRTYFSAVFWMISLSCYFGVEICQTGYFRAISSLYDQI